MRNSIVFSQGLKTFINIILVLFFGIATSCSNSNIDTTNSISTAPNFSLKDVNNNKVTLSDLKGKVVLLDFWATWCPPCRMELPHFKELYAKYKDKGFVIVGVAVDKEMAVKSYVKRERIPFKILISDRSTANLYHIRAFPTTFLLDKKGEIQHKWVGYRDKSIFEHAIKKLL